MMFRFSIRDLLWLTGVMALLFGWWAHYISYRIQTIDAASRVNEAFHDLEIAEYKAQHWQQKYEAQVAANSETQRAKVLTWEDLTLPHDDRFESGDLPYRAKELAEARVKITGFMHCGVESAKHNKEFVLLRSRSGKHGPGGPIDELILVSLSPGRTVAYLNESIEVEGTLRIRPSADDGGTIWSLYCLDDARVGRIGEKSSVDLGIKRPPQASN